MKKYLLIATILAFGLSGCTPPPAPQPKAYTYAVPTDKKLEIYQRKMRRVASGIKHDSKYTRIKLNTPKKKAWFKDITYKLWDRQITRGQFVDQGLLKYPKRRYEFNFIAKGFNR